MSIDQLTRRQKEVLTLIREKIEGRGYGPTVREIGENFDISSPNGVMCHLKALEKKGLITREPNMSRAIQLTEEAYGDRGMPLVGQIAAGSLTEAIEQADRFEFTDWFWPEELVRLASKRRLNDRSSDCRWRFGYLSPSPYGRSGRYCRGTDRRW